VFCPSDAYVSIAEPLMASEVRVRRIIVAAQDQRRRARRRAQVRRDVRCRIGEVRERRAARPGGLAADASGSAMWALFQSPGLTEVRRIDGGAAPWLLKTVITPVGSPWVTYLACPTLIGSSIQPQCPLEPAVHCEY